MKKQVISRGIFVDGLRKNLITFGIAGLVVIAFSFIMPFASINREVVRSFNFEEAFRAIGIATYAFTLIAMLILFSSFNKRAGSDFYLSLPYTRTCISLSYMLSVFTYVVILDVLAIGCSSLCYVINKSAFSLAAGNIPIFLACSLVATLYFLGVILIGVSLTGNILGNVVITALVAVVPRLMMYMFRRGVVATNAFLDNDNFLSFLQTRPNVFFCGLFDSQDRGAIFPSITLPAQNGWIHCSVLQVLYTLVLAVIVIVIAVILFNKRPSEIAAGFDVSDKTHIFAAVCMSLLLCALGLPDALGKFVPIFAIIGLCIYIPYICIAMRNGKRIAKALPFFLIIACVSLGMFFGAKGASKKTMSYQFKVENIEYIQYKDVNYGSEQMYTDKVFRDQKLKSKQSFNVIVAAINKQLKEQGELKNMYTGDNTRPYQLTVKTKNGGTKYRCIQLSDEDREKLTKALNYEDDFKKAYCTLPKDLTVNFINFGMDFPSNKFGYYGSCSVNGITLKQSKEILESLQKEINEIGFEKWFSFLSEAMNGSGIDETRFYIGVVDGNAINTNLYVSSVTTPKTADLIFRIYYENSKSARDNIVKNLHIFKDFTQQSYPTEEGTMTESNGSLRIRARTKNGLGLVMLYDQRKDRDKVCDLCKELIEYSEKYSTEPTGKKYVVIELMFPYGSDFRSVNNKSEYNQFNEQILLPFPENFDIKRFDEFIDFNAGTDSNENVVDQVLPTEMTH